MAATIAEMIKSISIMYDKQFTNQVLSGNELPKVTSTQMSVLQYMDRHIDEVITQRTLQDEFNLSKSTVSGIVQRLRKHKFIDAIPIANDKRSNQLVFNPEFRRLMVNHNDYFVDQLTDMNSRLVNGMTEEEIRQFTNLLERSLKNLDEHSSQM
ncbi:MarR family winged helix-turn-helix transcriptional regulator [Lentilactobacillus sp. SPB1-3]|uniref:MarR family winged helix-turn-helix transcriptional regulator n=1 Tax=Lentilactobacillus terminaliae TaxID=3003483 RepID=A0ACD5DE74_9LACO|nr:helix-turn-helix domain-containing protein [Lentilactobacillus sp. SPB1-3]MCZ0977733.1 helix-turn-helix domain-containing protein [Lentilactobacillus sp. SPB1-3]